jgi:hypothetical protein
VSRGVFGERPASSGDRIEFDGASPGICDTDFCARPNGGSDDVVPKLDMGEGDWRIAKELIVIDCVLRTVSAGGPLVVDSIDGGGHGCPERSVREGEMSETMLRKSMFDKPSMSVRQTWRGRSCCRRYSKQWS